MTWSGRRNLRRFIELAGEVGKTILRCGPWCHGEVRNGGHPDWLLKKGWRLRSNETNYLEKIRILCCEIAVQLQGQLWKHGGPEIGNRFNTAMDSRFLAWGQLGRNGYPVPACGEAGDFGSCGINA